MVAAIKIRDHTVKATKEEEIKVYGRVYQNFEIQKNSQFYSQKDNIYGQLYKILLSGISCKIKIGKLQLKIRTQR